MGSINKVILVGNLGRDAELRYTPGGQAVATLNMATTEQWNDKTTGAKQEKTEWHRINVWGKPAETLAEYLTKGKQIYVEGKLETRTWDDPKSGVKRYATEIRADRVVLLGSGSGRTERGTDLDGSTLVGVAAGGVDKSEPLTDDDIPFGWLMPFIVPAMGLLGVLSA